MSSARKLSVPDAVFVSALFLVSGLCVFTGIAMPVGSFPGDTFFLLGNAYRVATGQVPHVDFSSPWGPVIFLIEAGGLHLSGMRPSGLAYANAVFGPIFATWAFFVARARWSPGIACVIAVYTLLLIAAPFSLGNNPMDFSYAMVYNRYAYALFGIVLLECAADVLWADARVRQAAWFALSTGVALGLLSLLKISFALAALALVVALPMAGSVGGTRRLASVAGGFALVVFLGLAYLRFDVSDMLRDLAMAANSRAVSLQPSSFFGIFAVENAALLILAALVARHRGAFVALSTIAVGAAVLVTNQQLSGFPLDAYAAVALIAARTTGATTFSALPPGVALMAAVCVLPVYEGSSISLLSAAIARRSPPAGVSVLAMPERGTFLTFAAFRGQKSAQADVVRYTSDLSDGMNLLREHAAKRKGVLSLEEFDAFNYILDLPPPRGGFAAAAYDYIFDNATHPPAERFFGNALYVMVPKFNKTIAGEEDPNTSALLRIYGHFLGRRFVVVAETKHWVLWRRKTNE